MLTRLYVNNYKCLERFTFEPGEICVLLGRNGSGKSAIFDVLWKLKSFISGSRPLQELFRQSMRSRWSESFGQDFEIDLLLSGHTYRYRLAIAYDPERPAEAHIGEESLSCDGISQFEYRFGALKLGYGSSDLSETQLHMSLQNSVLATFLPKANAQGPGVPDFREWAGRLHCAKIDPFAMLPASDAEERNLWQRHRNFVSWLRYCNSTESSFSQYAEFVKDVSEALEGKPLLRLSDTGATERRILLSLQDGDIGHNGSNSKNRKKRLELEFDELSEGQKALINLYALSHFKCRDGTLVCIDEPDNFVSLREIQPWLYQVVGKALDGECQLMLVSHHPEVLDQLSGEYGVYLSRPNGKGAIARPWRDVVRDPGVKTSSILAYGWDGERDGEDQG